MEVVRFQADERWFLTVCSIDVGAGGQEAEKEIGLEMDLGMSYSARI